MCWLANWCMDAGVANGLRDRIFASEGALYLWMTTCVAVERQNFTDAINQGSQMRLEDGCHFSDPFNRNSEIKAVV